MKQYLYVIYDVLADECGPVFQAPNDKVAARAYFNLVETVAQRSRKDFILEVAGTIETTHGEIYGYAAPKPLDIDAIMASDMPVEEVR